MSTRKSSSKSFINKLSDRLQKLEVDRAIGSDHSHDDNYDPELAEIQARYAKYKEEKAEKWKRLGREPTYHESWAELTFSQFLYCIKRTGTPEERYQSKHIVTFTIPTKRVLLRAVTHSPIAFQNAGTTLRREG